VRARNGGDGFWEGFTGFIREEWAVSAAITGTVVLAAAGIGLAAKGAIGVAMAGAGKKGGKTVLPNAVVKQRTVEFKGHTVLQDDTLFSPKFVKNKVSNLDLMKDGLAPFGTDGKKVVIHHIDQTNTGPLTEMLGTKHTKQFGTLHSNTGQFPTQIDRTAFKTWRELYWIDRAGKL